MNTEQNCCPIHDDTHFCRYKLPGHPNSNCECVCTCSYTEQNDLSFVDPDGFKKADEKLKYGEVGTEQKGWRQGLDDLLFKDTLERDAAFHMDKDARCNCYIEENEIKNFIERTLQEYQEELVKKVAGAGRIHGERPFMWPLQEKDTYTTEDFDGTSERQWVRVWNDALAEAISLIKDTKPL